MGDDERLERTSSASSTPSIIDPPFAVATPTNNAPSTDTSSSANAPSADTSSSAKAPNADSSANAPKADTSANTSVADASSIGAPISRTISSTSSHATPAAASTIRARNRRKLATTPKTPTPAAPLVEDKSLTSFPSLSPESPKDNAASFAKPLPQGLGVQVRPSEEQLRSTAVRDGPSIVAALTAKSPSYRDRHALFEDAPTAPTQNIPGAIHHASDAHIQRLMARTGAVALVRQLAGDLAEREAEMSRLRQRTESRERELKKMLREVEVSMLDIEARLRQVDREPSISTTGASPLVDGGSLDSRLASTSSVDRMMREALSDQVGPHEDLPIQHSPDPQATVRGPSFPAGQRMERNSSQDINDSKSVSKTWKDYFWGSGGGGIRKTSRASSAVSGAQEEDAAMRARSGSDARKRRVIDDPLFTPPIEDNPELNEGSHYDKPRATSMSAWTLKIFAGNPRASREGTERSNSRGRASTQSLNQARDSHAASREPSQTSTHTDPSARATLARINQRSNQALRRGGQLPALGPTGTIKASSQSVRSLPINSPVVEDHDRNLGPVEMDAILPQGTRPPTLTPTYNNIDDASDFLTDRFGFIYDARRRKKEADALALMAASKSPKLRNTPSLGSDDGSGSPGGGQGKRRPQSPSSDQHTTSEIDSSTNWQDHLKVSTFPTELLSATPSPSGLMTFANDDIKRSLKRSPTVSDGDALHALTPIVSPTTSTVTASNADIAQPLLHPTSTPVTPGRSDYGPVKALLSQLTEIHDNLQREKTVKWNEFMRKVRAERRREGESLPTENRTKASETPEAALADGEMIGVATLGNKGKVGRAKYREFKSLVLAGIPVVHRAKVWSECSGASALRVPGYYADLVAADTDDPVIVSQIQMDIHRTLTDNVFFRRGPGVSKLNEVLLAYARRNPEVGYCQGMNLITASLLLIMPTAEDAFWLLVSLIEGILPRHYYDRSLLASRADQRVLREYVAELLPRLSTHLAELAIELEALTFQWFLSLFTDCLSAEALYRVWDVLLCSKDEEGHGGSTFLFQVALALLKLNEGALLACATPGEVYAYLGGEITNHAISIDGLISASEGLRTHVRRAEVEERRARWVAVELETVETRNRIRQDTAASLNSSSSDLAASMQKPQTDLSGDLPGTRSFAGSNPEDSPIGFDSSGPTSRTPSSSRSPAATSPELEVRPPMPIEDF